MTTDISPENVARMLERLRGRLYARLQPMTGTFAKDTAPAEAADMLEALSARLAEVTASIRWVDEVYPSRIEAGGAGVEITWAEFNAMQKAIGVREDKRIGDQERAASHNHRLRVARNQAVTRAEAAEAKLAASDYIRTGVMDKDGREICVGDHIRILLNDRYTKQEYWNPEYQVVFKAPHFTLRHIGGGKNSSTAHFYFDVPQKSSEIETISAALEENKP